MPALDLLRHRSFNQQLTQPRFTDPAELVAWFGAVQAQDYFGARWALGQRLVTTTDAAMEAAFDAGALLRTHVMRPTWHFVAPADLRWLLALTAPRVHQANGPLYRRCSLDAAVFKRAHAILSRALRDRQYQSREELGDAFTRAGLEHDGLRLGYLLMHAELEGLICSGPRRGKQFTYALLQERVPPASALAPEEALARLTRRYIQSHGPAQAHDFAWWSGLTLTQVNRGLQMIGPALTRETVDGKDYWFMPTAPPPIPNRTFLLPNYDEYGIAYKDRSPLSDPDAVWQPQEVDLRLQPHLIVQRGRIVGLWRRVAKAGSIVIEPRFFHPPSPAEQRALTAAAQGYEEFLGVTVSVRPAGSDAT